MPDSILCLIPARSGSKGVKNKNIRPLLGDPLIAYTIRTALEAMHLLDMEVKLDIVVSSDSKDYLELAEGMGVGIIHRPVKMAMDQTPMVEVVRHALEYCELKKNQCYQVVLLLQPTCPARQAWHVQEAYQLFRKRSANSLISVVRTEDAHPARMYAQNKEGIGSSLMKKGTTKNRQELPPVYHRNGAIYLFDRILVNQGKLISETPLLYEMDKKYSINIDDEIDWIYAEALCAYLKSEL